MLSSRGHLPSHAEENARFHYDTGNKFFELCLDPSLTYSCAYFETEQDDLATAQQQNELICRKLDLKTGNTLLDVGCGWGSLLFHAIEHHGLQGTGVTPSHEQVSYIEEEAKRRSIEHQLSLQQNDWRSMCGTFDRVVSVGMHEHVGPVHGADFFLQWYNWLKTNGVALLNTIGAMDQVSPGPWITKTFFRVATCPLLPN